MKSICLFTFVSIAFSVAQNTNLPSVKLEENNLDDSITQIFNMCKCVIFYLCDEQNFIIAYNQLNNTRVEPDYPLRRPRRITCSNRLYYCCQNRTATNFASTTRAPSTQMYPVKPTTTCGLGGPTTGRVIQEVPWVVAIIEKNTVKCGGALIHPKVVLTGQHCVVSSSPDSLVAVIRRESISPNFRSSLGKISKIIKHENYYSGGLYNDIALLILENTLTNIPTVCLPRPAQNFNGQRCVAVGWGTVQRKRTRKLKKVEVPIVEFQTCQNLLRNSSLGADFTLHSSFICAGGERGKNTVPGSGGGPLMCKENGRYLQVGIVSWGAGRNDAPGLYTNVPNFQPWIEQKLRAENLS